jgi:hypothetical protein
MKEENEEEISREKIGKLIATTDMKELIDNPIFWAVKERDKYWKGKIRKILSKPHTLKSLTFELERLLE